MFRKRLCIVVLALASGARPFGAEELATSTVSAGGAPVPNSLCER